jgi:LysR family carnitine catabolism transcriptional activator|nr:LysR family transcriptional regulator [Glaciecola sp. XM2]
MLAFVSVAQSATFAEAAEKLYLSQPALSTSIKNMETQLGGQLFARTTRKVMLTPEGKAFLPTAKRLIADWDGALSDVQNLFSVQQGRLTVAAMPSFAEGHLAGVMALYHQQHPNIRLRVLDVIMEQVIEAVLSKRADIGFVFEPENLKGLIFHPLLTDNFCVVMRKDDIYANKKQVTLEHVAAHPLLMTNVGSSIRRWLDAVFEAHNLETTIVADASQLGTLGQFVKQGLGWSIVPQLCEQQMQAKELVCVPLKGGILQKRVGMIATSQEALSSAAKKLWAQLADEHHNVME